MKYKFYRGDEFLGIVVHETDDFPNHMGSFQPSEAYKYVAPLFERELDLLHSGKLKEWGEIRAQIVAPGIRLEAMEGQIRSIENPLIHIDGEEVWWR